MKPILFSFVYFVCFGGTLPAADRVALVIGCNKYTNLSEGKQLTSPVSDATDVAATLKALGYTLVTGAAVTDAGKEAIITATETFAQEAHYAEAAVFYFSGHGIQVGEDNFLMPSDTPRITSYTVLKNRSIHLRDTVMVALEEAKAKTKVIILDCCRENPFAEQVDIALGQIGKSIKTKGGLGEISGYGPGFFLAFATSPGTIADDGNGQRNSPFTAALLGHLKTSSGDDITSLFRRVKATVRQLSGAEQVPWTNDSLDESFIFLASRRGDAPANDPGNDRNRLTAYADEAIATASRAAYVRLWKALDDPRQASLVNAARAEILRVLNFYLGGTRIDRYDIPVATYFPEQGPLKDNQLTDELLIVLLHGSKYPWEVRMKAANLLGVRRSLAAADALVKAVVEDENLDVVKEATYSFEQLTEYHAKLFDADSMVKWWTEYKRTSASRNGGKVALPPPKAGLNK